jgi:hypothetical protein
MKLKEIINNLIPDFSAVPGFLKFLSGGITAIPKVFSKNFFKQRYYLHFFVSIAISFVVIRFMCVNMHLADTPIWFQILCGWVIGYLVNIIREEYLEDTGKAKFDWNDVHAGAYGGIVGSILYILLIT